MTTMDFYGNEVKVLEHMKEIKEKTSLFNRFYNKKQMLKFYLDKFIFREDGKDTEEDYDWVLKSSNGLTPCGRRVTIGSTDTSVTFVKLEDLHNDIAKKNSVQDEVLSSLDWDSFFMKADDGQIYYVEVNED